VSTRCGARHPLNFDGTSTKHENHGGGREELVGEIQDAAGHGGLDSNKSRRGKTERGRDSGDL